MGWLRFPFALICLLVVLAVPAHAEKRVALVIGNSAYEHVPALANPKNDAADMADKLEALGFEVVRGSDLTLSDMRKTAREFTNKLEGADLSLFFYAGHGLQVNGNNYMAPVDARLGSYDDLDYEVLPMDLIVGAMERKTKVNLIFLDACRDNPLAENLARSMGTRSGAVGRGLAKLGSGIGTLIAFATQPGNVALDGAGRNSPFTTALLKHLGTPGQDVTRDLIHVRRAVLEATQGKQVPWDNSSLTGEVILKEAPKEEAKPLPEAKAPEAASEKQLELAYWNAIKDGGSVAYFEAYLQQYPNGTFAGLARLRVGELKAAEERAKQEAEAKAKTRAEATAKAEAEAKAKLEAEAKAKLEAEAKAKAEAEAKAKLEAEAKAKAEAEAKAKQETEAKARAEAEAKAKLEAEADAKAKAEAAAKAEEKPIEVAKLEEPPVRSIDPVQLALDTQKELIRLGCLSGKADGNWGSGSEKALKDYAGRQGIKLASLEPATDVLDRLKATTVRVCPLICGKGMEEKNGRCERVKQEANVQQPAPKARSGSADEAAGTNPASLRKTVEKRTCRVCREGSGPNMGRGWETQCFTELEWAQHQSLVCK